MGGAGERWGDVLRVAVTLFSKVSSTVQLMAKRHIRAGGGREGEGKGRDGGGGGGWGDVGKGAGFRAGELQVQSWWGDAALQQDTERV